MRRILLAIVLIAFAAACNKSNPPAPSIPKVGAKWTYRFKKFNAAGVLASTVYVTYTATSEQTIGSDKFLAITDSTGATLFLLGQKQDGLYQYADAMSSLLCKDPANVNDTYTTHNNGSDEDFTVVSKDTTISVPYGDVKVYNYEGDQNALVKDLIWYNSAVWFAKKEVWVLNTYTGLNHVDTRIELADIEY